MAKPTFGTELFEDGSAYISFDDAMDMLENFELTPEAKRGAIAKARKAHQADKAKTVEEARAEGRRAEIEARIEQTRGFRAHFWDNPQVTQRCDMLIDGLNKQLVSLSPQPTPEEVKHE